MAHVDIQPTTSLPKPNLAGPTRPLAQLLPHSLTQSPPSRCSVPIPALLCSHPLPLPTSNPSGGCADGRRGRDGSSAWGAARRTAGGRRARRGSGAQLAGAWCQAAAGGRAGGVCGSESATAEHRADDGRTAAAPDTAAACLIRVESNPTRIDALIRVDVPKKFRTRVSR